MAIGHASAGWAMVSAAQGKAAVEFGIGIDET
jgi:hypothetical protein